MDSLELRAELAEWTDYLYRLEPGTARFRDLYRLYQLLDELPQDEQRAWHREHGDQARRTSVAHAPGPKTKGAHNPVESSATSHPPDMTTSPPAWQ